MIRMAVACSLGALTACVLGPAAPAQTGDRIIAGVVSSAASGQPLEGADVTLREAHDLKIAAEVVTDAEGRFSFSNLPDGKFLLVAFRRGYAPTGFEQHDGAVTAIVTGENLDTTGLALSLPPLGAIFGTATEDSGDPVPQARLSLYRQTHGEGVNRILRASAVVADSMGNFEFPRLAPGTYYLCASGNPWYSQMNGPMRWAGGDNAAAQSRSALDLAYPLTCFPDVPDPAGAEAISLNAGDHVQADITFHPVPAVHISFQVAKSDTQGGIAMPQLRQEVFGITDFIGAGQSFFERGNGNDEGSTSVEISGIAPGQYNIELQGPNQAVDVARAGSIDVSSSDLRIDASSLHPMATVSGKLVVADNAGLPNNCTIFLVSAQGESAASAAVAADGAFQMRQALPGNYEVRVNASGRNLAVVQLAVNGAKVDGSALKVNNDPIELTVFALQPATSITGFVTRDEKPASGVFVLLVPADLKAGRYAWRPNQSDSDGSFDFENVVPGQYTAVAIERGWTLDWKRPEVIGPYLAKGAKVTVHADSKRINLQAPLEAQTVGGQQAQ